MEFRIADTFTDSLARLTGDEQKGVKTTAFDLQLNPANPGLQFHKIDNSKDKNFSSVRVSRDIRLVVHRTAGSLLLCYVDHHDKAYAWAERRKIETHPKTGAAQIVEIRERVQEVLVPVFVQPIKAAPPTLFTGMSDDDLLSCGVPLDWLNEVRSATEESLLALVEHLPGEAAEALLELATGGKPKARKPAEPATSPFDHPDAQRRFRIMADVEELERALDYPWDRWTVFLHPAQRDYVEQDFDGPARVSGSAGTGKTIVALHRAVFLARKYPDSRVLLTTFSDTLASALSTRLRRLISNQPRLGERLEVQSLDVITDRLYERHFGRPKIASRDVVRQFLAEASASGSDPKLSFNILLAEWDEVVDPWQLATWEAYRDFPRLGRKTRLPEPRRAALWAAFESIKARLTADGYITRAGIYAKLAAHLVSRKQPPFDFVVVDEAQDLNVPQVRLLAALGGNRQNGLFFAGDLGQRIFQLPFSWKTLGVDIQGRSHTLHVNYRTSHQIRTRADRLLGPQVADVDGNTEERRGTTSVFNGPAPVVRKFKSQAEEREAVSLWLSERSKEGMAPHEIAVFVRSDAELERARAAVEATRLPFRVLDAGVETRSGLVSMGTMHLAKGLEFRAVVVMACDDEVIPLQSRIETASDDSDLVDVYNTERHLLYVACTRARDRLLVTSVEPASEFLDDLES